MGRRGLVQSKKKLVSAFDLRSMKVVVRLSEAMLKFGH